MTATERAQVLVAARLLRATSKLDWLSTGLTFIAAAAFVAPGWHPLAILVVALGALARWYAFQIDFDARLLEDVAADALTREDLDEAFRAMALAPEAKLGRDWNERCRGARGLVSSTTALFVAQVAAFLVFAFTTGR